MASTRNTSVRYTLTLLFLINVLNFFDRAVPAVVLEPMRIEFALDDTSMALAAVAFTLLHALVGIPLGRLADTSFRTKVIAAGVFVWSLFTGLSGFAWSFLSFAAARAGVGIGEASCAPAANSMISDLVPARKRARATGYFMLGYPIGTLACYLLVGTIAAKAGWRLPFFLAALPGLLFAVLIYRCAEPLRGAHDAPVVGPTGGGSSHLFEVLRNPAVLLICLFGSLVTVASYALTTFLPAFLMRVHGLPIGAAGKLAGLVLGLTGLIGLTAGGWLADRAHIAWRHGRLTIGVSAMFGAAPLVWFGLASPAGELARLTSLLAIGWLLYYFYFVTVYPALMEAVRPHQRGMAMGVFYFCANVFGGGLGTYMTGALSDHFARQAMLQSGATSLTNALRAGGLQQAMQAIIPLALLLAGLALLCALWSLARERRVAGPAAQRREPMIS